MPSWHRNKTPSVFKARVLAVDKVRCTMTVLGENNERFDGIPLPSHYVGSKGQGSFWTPEQNSILYLCSPSDGVAPFVVAGCALPREQGDDDTDQDDFRQARPVLNEGDQVVASSDDGNFIILRKGGVIEIGASQTAQRLYVPVNSMIMDFCQDYQLQTTGGILSWKTRRDDTSHGGGTKTPAEFRLQIKEFTGEDPLVDLGFGRIQDEDDERLVGGGDGEIVARLLINDRFRFWIDKSGNVMHYVHGETVTEHNGKVVERYTKNKFQQVLGTFQSRIGSRHATVSGEDYLEVGGSRTVVVKGDLNETIEGTYKRNVKGYTDDIDGSRETSVRGFEKKSVLGFEEKSVTDDKVVSVGKGYKEVVGGKRSFKVTNSQVASEEVGFEVTVAAGKVQVFAMTGNVEICVGGATPDLVLSKITAKPTGAVVIESTPAAGLSTVEVNPTGVKVSTPAGEMSVDQLGTVALGLPAGQGAVVTTLTHPVCYVTGAPILGSSSVVAGGIPSPVGLASTFVPDVT